MQKVSFHSTLLSFNDRANIASVDTIAKDRKASSIGLYPVQRQRLPAYIARTVKTV